MEVAERRKNRIPFLFKKIFNYSLALLAYNCPFNSWRVNFHRWRGVTIGKDVTIGFHVTLDHSYPKFITIEDDVTLSGENYILTHSTPKVHWKNVLPSYVAPVIIKKRKLACNWCYYNAGSYYRGIQYNNCWLSS